MKTKSLTTVIITTLILSLGVFGIPLRVFAQSPPSTLPFTGEEVYRGIVFGQSPVSQLFPEIWASDEVRSQLPNRSAVVAWNHLKENVVAQIKSTDSTFMDRFGSQMQSGDHATVQSALTEAGQKTNAALQALGYLDSQGTPVPDASVYKYTYVYVAAYGAVVVVGVAVIAVAAAAILVKILPPAPIGTSEQDSQLWRDTLINWMVERLDPAQ